MTERKRVLQTTISVVVAAVLIGVVIGDVTPALDAAYRGVLVVLRERSSHGWGGVVDTISQPRLLYALQHSLLVASAAAVASVVVAMVTTMRIRDMSSTMRRTVVALILAPLFIPGAFHGLILQQVGGQIGLGKSWSLFLVSDVVYVLPYVGVIVLLQFRLLPASAHRAVRDLGVGLLDQGRLLMGAAWAGLLTAILFGWLLTFNEFERGFYLSPRETYATYVAGVLGSGGGGAANVVGLITLVGGAVTVAGIAWLGYRSAGMKRDE